MSVNLLNTIVSDSGVSEPCGQVVRTEIGAPHATEMRVSARSAPGNPYPPGPYPDVSIETSEDGKTWSTLVERTSVDNEGVEAITTFPVGNDLRVRWHFDEPCFETTYWWLRVWVG